MARDVPYGRKGLAISIHQCGGSRDLDCWVKSAANLCTLCWEERRKISFLSTPPPRVQISPGMGFSGRKNPLSLWSTEGDEGLKKNIAVMAERGSRSGPIFRWARLLHALTGSLCDSNSWKALAPYDLEWIEECLPCTTITTVTPQSKPRVTGTCSRHYCEHDYTSLCVFASSLPAMRGHSASRTSTGLAE